MCNYIEFVIDFEKTSIIYIFSKYDRNFIINLIDSIDDDDIGNNELSSFSYNIKEALKAEIGKNYESSSDYFITAYEIIKDKIPYSEKTEAKKFFENKISKMQYNLYHYNKMMHDYIAFLRFYSQKDKMTSILLILITSSSLLHIQKQINE